MNESLLRDLSSAPQPLLLFGDCPEDLGALTRRLEGAGLRVAPHAARSLADLVRALGEHEEAVIVAYFADEAVVRELAAITREHAPGAPILVVGSAAPVAALIRAGARDAVPSSDPAHLAAAIEREAATARQTRELAALAGQARRLEQIIDNVPVMIFAKDATRLKVEVWNKMAEQVTGVSRTAMFENTTQDLFPQEAEAFEKIDREVIANKVAVSIEESISTAEGLRWLISSKVPLFDEKGEAIALLGCSQDITERRASEQALAQTNRKLAESEEAKLALIDRLRYAVDELSNPILEVWDDVLMMPIIGVVDSRRAADMVQRLLAEVVRTQASFVIVDLTGVEVVDTKTADHLMKLMRKVELVGARCVLTGIRTAVAETLVEIGVDLGRLRTLRNLKHGLREALSATQRHGAEGPDLAGKDLDARARRPAR